MIYRHCSLCGEAYNHVRHMAYQGMFQPEHPHMRGRR